MHKAAAKSQCHSRCGQSQISGEIPNGRTEWSGGVAKWLLFAALVRRVPGTCIVVDDDLTFCFEYRQCSAYFPRTHRLAERAQSIIDRAGPDARAGRNQIVEYA